jgi:hypothetical protein
MLYKMERLEQSVSNAEKRNFWEESTDLKLDARKSTDIKKLFDTHFDGSVLKWTAWFWTKAINFANGNWEGETNDPWKQILFNELWTNVIWLQTVTKDKSVFRYSGEKWTLVFSFTHLNHSWDVRLDSTCFYNKWYKITEQIVWWTKVDIMRISESDRWPLPQSVVEAL